MSDKNNQGFFGSLKSILSRNVILIFAIQFFQNISAVMGGTWVGPLGKATGLAASAIGMAATLYTVFGLLTRGPAARLTDGDRKKATLILGIGGRGVVFLLMGIFKDVPAAYVILRCLQGITWSIVGVSLVSCMSMIVDKKVLGTAYSIFNLMLTVGKIFAKPFAQKMFSNYGFMAASAVTFGAAMIAVVLILFLDFKDPHLQAPKSRDKSLNPFKGILLPAIPLAMFVALSKFGYNADNLYTSVWMAENGIDPTAAYALSGTLGAFLVVGVGVLCDLIGAKWLTVIMLLADGIGLYLIGIAKTPAMFMLAYLLHGGIGLKVDIPAQILIMKAAPKSKQGGANATKLFCNDAVSAVSTTIVGFVIDHFGYATGFALTGAASLLGGVAILLLGNMLIKKLDELKEPETEAAA